LTIGDCGRTVHFKMTWWRKSFGVLWCVGLLIGCEGGQTGQPTTASACWEPVALDTPIEGVSAQQLLDAYVGKYAATLHWQGDAGVPPDEAITIEIAPAPDGVAREAASYPCYRSLVVPAQASLTFADGSVLSGGNAAISSTYGMLDGELSFAVQGMAAGAQRSVNATLSGSPGRVHIEGKLETEGDGGLTGLFSSDDGAAGGGQ
jgi:hypothetical protein